MTGSQQAMMAGAVGMQVGLSSTLCKVSGPGNQDLTTTSTTASVSGGTAPYTYTWAFASGGDNITILSPNSPTTAFRGMPGVGGALTGNAVLTVHDSLGAVVASPTVIVRILGTQVGGGGGGGDGGNPAQP